MTDMKCPFCNTPLVHENMSDYWCVHCNTQEQKGLYGSDKLWLELIRTRKALDVAVDEINKIKVAAESVGIGFFMTAAIVALAKINTALEQKEHFADASKTIEQKDK